MRAICESCAKPQPVDWRPGDLCIECGLAVRQETRCFWCAKWTPFGKFCRKCGAGSVSQEQYGPARMLKSMGASVFEIPKLLAELDPELIATHQSIYATHAAAMNRHVDDARWLGQFLYQKHWAGALEDELIPQLPWGEAALATYAVPAAYFDSDVSRAAALAESSPLSRLRELAELVRVHLGDFSGLRGSTHLVYSNDPEIAAEAALQFSGWRAIYTVYTEINRYDLIALLEKSPYPQLAAPRMAALGAKPQPRYAPVGDADTDFLVQILDENTHVLEANLDSRDAMRRYVAAEQLIRLRRADRIGPVLLAAGDEQQLQLLRTVSLHKRAIPALHEVFFELAERSPEEQIRKAAAHAISLGRDHADSLRLLASSDERFDVVHSLLRAKLPPETLYEIGQRLVQSDKFTMDQWGWDEAAKPNAMPMRFVEDQYPHASNKVKAELLRFAEKQIEAHGESRTSLERHLIRQCFAKAPAELIGAAWASIHRIQMHRQVGLTVPCDLSMENVAWCWTMPDLLTAIAGLMANPEAVEQTFVRDDFSRFLRTAEADFFEAARQYPDECAKVIAAATLADPYSYSARFAEELKG
ncbi:MAG: hypothetical protein HYX27_11360 [Acidobacteria bacterium]|nr:hypothetical protein [Acidobacteriota bacterium]